MEFFSSTLIARNSESPTFSSVGGGRGPDHRALSRGTFADGAAVGYGQAVGVATDEVAPATDVEGAWPAVGVEGDDLSRRHTGVEDADELVFK